MITERQIEIGRKLLGTGLVKSFYHSVELVEDQKGKKFPAYKTGAEQLYVGPDDRKQMFAYIRQSGQASRLEERPDGGCSKSYRMGIPHRIVVFKDREDRDFDALVQKMLSISFLKDVSLLSFHTNAFQLSKDESPIGDFSFDATTFYMAIDLQIKIWLSAKDCEDRPCIAHPNPICS